MSREQIERSIQVAYALAVRESQRSLWGYLSHVVIDSRPEPRRWGEIAEPWQREIIKGPVNALDAVAELKRGYNGPWNFLRVLPRGHDKSSSIGRICNGLLGFSRRPLSISVAASDTEQAGIIWDCMHNEARLNPWLNERLKFHTRTVSGVGGKLRILAADAPGTFGRTDDLIICDEFTHWSNRELFDTLWSGSGKRSTTSGASSVFIIISNAGVLYSWQDEIRQIALKSNKWNVFEAGGMLSSWMSKEKVEEIRETLPPALARRVLDNVWIDAAEEGGYLTASDIYACDKLGQVLGLKYAQPPNDWRRTGKPTYFAAIDYGPKRDRTVAVLVHRDNGILVVDRMDVRIRQGNEENVPIAWVEEWIDRTNELFGVPRLLVLDPFQMENTAQKYELRQSVERFEARGGKKNFEMAACLRDLIVNKKIAWYPECGLLPGAKDLTFVDELRRLVLKPMPYGYRFDHDATGHDDRTVAVGMAALAATREQLPTWVPPPKLKIEHPRRQLWGLR